MDLANYTLGIEQLTCITPRVLPVLNKAIQESKVNLKAIVNTHQYVQGLQDLVNGRPDFTLSSVPTY